MAGFEAISALEPTEQWVAVWLTDAAPCEITDIIDRVVFRKALDHHVGKSGEIVCADLMVLCQKSCRILERGGGQAQFLGCGSHLNREGFFGSGNAFRKYDAGIIPGLNNHTMEEVHDGHVFANGETHCGTT